MRRTASDSKMQRPKLKRLSTKASKLAEKREMLLRKQGGSPKVAGGRNGRGGSRGGKYKVHSRTGQNQKKTTTPKLDKPAAKKKTGAVGKYCRMICSSDANLNIDLKLPVALEAVRRLHLSGDDLRVLRKNFNYIDEDESGEIDYLEFLDHMGERRTVFTDKVYSLIDENGDGELEFDEFVAVCGTLCCWSKEETLKFCFDAFDLDGGGTLDEEEFMELAKAVTKEDPTFPGNFSRALSEFDTNGDGLIDFDEFRTMNQRYPMTLYPIFKLQLSLQKATLGENRWNRILRDIQTRKNVLEYRRNHGGEMPPESFMTAFLRFGKTRIGAEDSLDEVESSPERGSPKSPKKKGKK